MKGLLCFFLCLIAGVLSAQQMTACGYYGDNAIFTDEQICKQLGYENTKEAEKIIMALMDRVGLKMNFLVVECNTISNAFAINFEGDIGLIRYIIYDRDFLELINMKTQSDFSAISVFAHEIGHHLNGHTLDGKGSRPDKELEADEFSGFVMFQLGATLEQAQAAMAAFSGEKTSATHPGKADRLAAIAQGWQNAEVLVEKYRQMSRNADYTTYAKMWFEKAFEISGASEQDLINRVAYYGKATEYKADYVAAYRNKAKYLNMLGLYKEALKDANRAISLDKKHWNAYAEKATALLGLEEYNKAIEYYSLVIKNRSKASAYDYAARGWAHHMNGSKEAAKSDLKKALSLKPNWPEAQQRLAIVSQ